MLKQLENLLFLTREQRRTESVQERQHRDSVVFVVIYTLQLIPLTVNPVPGNGRAKVPNKSRTLRLRRVRCGFKGRVYVERRSTRPAGRISPHAADCAADVGRSETAGRDDLALRFAIHPSARQATRPAEHAESSPYEGDDPAATRTFAGARST